MRAAGDIQDFEGGVASQRDHLNTWIDDYKDLVDDVEAIERKVNANWLEIIQIVTVALGTEGDDVIFVNMDVVGTITGPVTAEA